MTTVLVCAEDAPARTALVTTVGSVAGVDRVMAVDSAHDMVDRFASYDPDLVLLSLRDSGGLEATRALVAEYPNANVIVLAGESDRDSVVAAIAGGARGFLAAKFSHEEVCAAVASALANRDLGGAVTVIPRQVREPGPETTSAAAALTEREMQVLRGMSEGKSNGQIGRDLYLSEDTIKTHARRLFRKLGVRDRAQAVALGFRRGLVR